MTPLKMYGTFHLYITFIFLTTCSEFENCMFYISIYQEDQDAGQSVGQRKRVKLSSSTKGKCHAVMYRNFISETFLICGCPVLLSDLCIIESLKHKCFLEELLFWTIKYEFPQKMVTFLLNMLPDQDYKVFYLQTCSYSLMIMDNLSTIVLEPWVAIVAFIFIRL